MKKQPESWTDIFNSATKQGRALLNTATFSRAIAVLTVVTATAIAVSYGLTIMNTVFIIQNTFFSSQNVSLVPSASPTCAGDYTLTVGENTIDCLGTSPTAILCDNGYEGILFDGALLCPISSQVVFPGLQCALGGIVLFYQNNATTFNVTTCIEAAPTEVTCANGQSGIRFGNTTVCNDNFVDSATVVFTTTAGNVSANAILTLADTTATGTSIISFASANTGTFKTLLATGLVRISGNGTNVLIDGSYSVSSNGGGISPIVISNATTTILKTFTNSSSVTFSTSGSTISANALVTASNAALSGQALFASYSGNNIVMKMLLDIPGFLEYSSTPTGIQIVSFITAYNVPYTGFNPLLFPDCPFITTQSDVNVCLAGRTVGFIANATNAANVQYFPAMPFQNQTQFSVAAGFDLIFEDQLPSFTRIIYVNGATGNDLVNGGGQFDPYASVDKAVSVVPVVPFTDFYTILVSIDEYTVGNISFPPNTNLISYNRFKQTRLNFCPGCKITLSSAWSTFANDHVEAGISGFTLNGDVDIDFTTLGAAGVNSDARFLFSETSILGTVNSQGRGNTDLFHIHNIEMHNGFTGNCQNVHAEYSSSLSSMTLNDDNCYSNMTYLVIYNVFGDNSNLTIKQNTSDVHADIFINAYDDNAWMVLRGSSRLYVDTYTIPLNFDADPNITIVFTFNSQGGRSCGLNTAYFSASCLNNAQILIEIRQHALKGITSGAGGISAIYNTTIQNVIFNEFASLTDIFSITPSGTGLIYYNINIANTTNIKCPEGTLKWGTIGDYQTCKPFAFTPANLGVSFTTDNFIDFVESGSGLDYIVTFLGQITFNDSTYFSVFKNPSGTFQIFYRNPLQDIVLSAGTNMAVTPGSSVGNFSISTTLNPTFTTVSTSTNFIVKNGSTVCYFNAAGTFSNCFSAAFGLAANLNLNWPTTAGNQGDILVKSAGNQASWSSSAITLNAGSGVNVTPGLGSNNYTISSTNINTLNAGNNMVVTPGLGSGNFTVATTTTPIFTTMTVNGATITNGVILPSGNSIKFNDINNNATITMIAPNGLTQSYTLGLPTTPGLAGQVLQANGDGSADWIGIRRRIFESCANGTTLGALSTAFNTLVAGTACATGPASKFIAANTIRVGTIFDMIIAGIISRTGSVTIQTRILVNSTVAAQSAPVDTGVAASGFGFKATIRCLFQTIGVSGSVLCTGDFIYDRMSSIQVLSTTVPVTVDTTSVLFFDMQLAYGSSSASNFFTSSMTGMYIAL